MGRRSLSIWHSGYTLVLDRRYPSHALPWHCDDAVLLHLEDAFGSWVSPAAVWRGGSWSQRGKFWTHDRTHERREYVLDGSCHEGRAWMGHQFLDLGRRFHRRALCHARRAAFGNHQ